MTRLSSIWDLHLFCYGDFATVKLTFLGLDAKLPAYILPSMSGLDRKEVVFQATAVDNNQQGYAIQKAPGGLFYMWKGNYPSTSEDEEPGLDKFTLTPERSKFASGEWILLESSIPCAE